jgi:stress-induced morphogen
MALITRGPHDERVNTVLQVLEEYERFHPGANASVYRQNSGSIRIRILDDRFTGWSRGQRHDYVWDFIVSRLSEDDMQEISVLLPITRAEQGSSFMNFDFDDPLPSTL